MKFAFLVFVLFFQSCAWFNSWFEAEPPPVSDKMLEAKGPVVSYETMVRAIMVNKIRDYEDCAHTFGFAARDNNYIVTIQFKIEKDGTISHLATDLRGNEKLNQCLKSITRLLVFPASGLETVINQPFNFCPKDKRKICKKL